MTNAPRPPFVKIQKLAAVEKAHFPPADPLTLAHGLPAAAESLPLNYTIFGWLINAPAPGECVCVLRLVRNGIWCEGFFRSSPVVSVLGNTFDTQNSRYRIGALSTRDLELLERLANNRMRN